MNTRRIATITILIFLAALALMACVSEPWIVVAYPTYTPALPSTPAPLYDFNQEAANVAAQATLAAGQNAIADLSYQATLVSMEMAQAAKAAAQTTLDYNQRRLMDLSIKGTEVSQNMAWAAATQQFIAGQTQMVWDATAAAQNQAATATYDAYNLHVTQTAQVQALLDVKSTQAAQSRADQRAYELTATPWAAAQAEIAQTQDESERRAWWADFVFTPLTLILSTLIVLLLIAAGVIAYWRLIPALELRLRTIALRDENPVLLVEGTIVEPAFPVLQPQLPDDGAPVIEIVGPSEASVVNWITEAEHKLRTNGGLL